MYNYRYPIDNFDLKKPGNILKVMGEGIVNLKPDIAQVVIGVITENVKLKESQNENTRIVNGIISSLTNMGIKSSDMQTTNYTVRIKNDYVDGKEIFRGYEVSNYLKISVTDIDSVGEVIDVSVDKGANFIDKINFVISDTTKYYNQALKLAIEDAQNKAIIMSSKLKAKVNILPLKIVEKTHISNEFSPSLALKTSNSTPIEAGETSIQAIIEAVFVYI